MKKYSNINRASSLALEMYNSKKPTLVQNEILGDLLLNLRVYPGEIDVEEYDDKHVMITKLPYQSKYERKEE